MNTKVKKVHAWLAELGSHSIYSADNIGKSYTDETGRKPCWPVHSAHTTRKAIEARAIGGYVEGDCDMAYGYEIAESLAEHLTQGREHQQYSGRGRRFYAALDALKKADV